MGSTLCDGTRRSETAIMSRPACTFVRFARQAVQTRAVLWSRGETLPTGTRECNPVCQWSRLTT